MVQQYRLAPSVVESNHKILADMVAELRDILGLQDGESLTDAVRVLKHLREHGKDVVIAGHIDEMDDGALLPIWLDGTPPYGSALYTIRTKD